MGSIDFYIFLLLRGLFMKYLFVILLLANIAWLANAAALNQADQQATVQSAAKQHTLLDQEMPKEVHADIIARAAPELVDFLLRRNNKDAARQEIPNFGLLTHVFAISDKYSRLVICLQGGFNAPGQLIIWDLALNELQKIITVPHSILKALITPDGETLITVDCDENVSIWNMNSFEKKYDLGPCCNSRSTLVALNSDGSKLVTTGFDYFKIWDVQTGKAISENVTVEGDPMLGTVSFADHVALSPDGTKVAFSFSDGCRVLILDATNHHRLRLFLFNLNEPGYMQFGADGTTIMTWNEHYGNFSYRTLNVLTGGLLLDQKFPCYKGRIGSKRIEINGCNDRCVTIFDNCTGQFLCSICPHSRYRNSSIWDSGWCYAVTDNWAVASVDTGHKICAWKLQKCFQQNNELMQALGLISERQLWFLRDKVMKATVKYKKLVLNRSNPAMAEMIRDYESLPKMIKKRVKDSVKFVDAKVQERAEK